MSTTTTQPDAVRECSEALANYLSAIRTSRSVSETNRASIVFSTQVSYLLPAILAQAEANRLLIEVGRAAVEKYEAQISKAPVGDAEFSNRVHVAGKDFVRAMDAFRAARERGTGK